MRKLPLSILLAVVFWFGCENRESVVAPDPPVPSFAIGIGDPCSTHCDCPQGILCYHNICLEDPIMPVYCCAKTGSCPPGHWCVTPGNTKSSCAENPDYVCEDACDCGPAHACLFIPELGGKRCVKDEDDPRFPGPGLPPEPPATTPTAEIPPGEPTYCCTSPFCYMGRHSYGENVENFSCYNPVDQAASNFCGIPECKSGVECGAGNSCVDTKAQPVPAGTICTVEGGSCVSYAVSEVMFGYTPGDIMSPCSSGGIAGFPCDAGWMTGGQYTYERVVGIVGTCGNGVCDQGEYPDTCADCSCGDGKCSPSELFTCDVDCGMCGNGDCEDWESVSTCPDDCLAITDPPCGYDCRENPFAVCGDGFCWVSELLTCKTECDGAVVHVPIDSELSDDEAGYVFVWVLTTPDFDAAEVDPATATLGNNDGLDTPVATKKKGEPKAKFKDVDRDGDDDLRLQFKTKELEKNGDIVVGDNVLTLNAATFGGTQLQGALGLKW